jgi:hypothetical protein
MPDGWRRGVIFISEFVPRRLIATVAKICYDEPYRSAPMRHRLELENGTLREGSIVEYEWRFEGAWNSLRAETIGQPQPIAEGSEEEFITEHYWGYTARRNGKSSEYQVEHPRWNFWRTRESQFHADVAKLYGEKFTDVLSHPKSAFVADGSPITVYQGLAI